MILSAMERAAERRLLDQEIVDEQLPADVDGITPADRRVRRRDGISGRLRRRGGQGSASRIPLLQRRAGLAVRNRQEIPPAQRRRDRARTSKPEEFSAVHS